MEPPGAERVAVGVGVQREVGEVDTSAASSSSRASAQDREVVQPAREEDDAEDPPHGAGDLVAG